MEQPSVEKRMQVSFEDDNKETISAKRMKSGSVMGKSVVVLRQSDIIMGKSSVLMPNTIEMAQLKKQVKGQFKRNIQISSNMTEVDVKDMLIGYFPILRHQRFCCAAAADNRTRLDFHGERRIWNGHLIRRRIKGNSALYILIEEENHQQSECSSWESEKSSSELDRDGITTEEIPAHQVVSDITQIPERHYAYHASHPRLEKQAVLGNPLKQLTTYPIVQSGLAQQTSEEKNCDNLQLAEGKFMRHETMDKFSPPQGFVLVASQRGMLPSVHHASVSTIHSMTNARDVVTMATSSLPQPLRMGSVMVSGGGIAVAQPEVIANQAVSSASTVAHLGLIGGKAISTASDHQSLEKTVFHVAKGPGAWHAGLPIVSGLAMVPQTLTPQMNSLNISTATPQQMQKQVFSPEKSIGVRNQDTQTEATETFQQVPPITTWQQSEKSYPVEYSNKTLAKEGAKLKPPAQSRQSHSEKANTTQVMERACSNTTDEGRQHCSSRVLSDYEIQDQSQISDQTDSGIETADNVGGNRLPLLLDAIEIMSASTEEKSIVDEICPKESSIRGGDKFVLILNKDLPSDTDEGYHATFGTSSPVVLTKVNQVNLMGRIPAYPTPGSVTVKVLSSTGRFLGETSFKYTDMVEDILKKLVHDAEMQSKFFHCWAQELGNVLSEPEILQPGDTEFKKSDKERRVYEEHDYDADDEGSDDGDGPYTKGWSPNSKMFSEDDEIERTGYREGIGQLCRPLSGESLYVNYTYFGLFAERRSYSQDLNNFTPYSLIYVQESRASISEVQPPANPSGSSDKVAGAAFDNSGIARYSRESPERTNDPENMDIVQSQLNDDAFDQNSGDEEEDDSPGNPL